MSTEVEFEFEDADAAPADAPGTVEAYEPPYTPDLASDGVEDAGPPRTEAAAPVAVDDCPTCGAPSVGTGVPNPHPRPDPSATRCSRGHFCRECADAVAREVRNYRERLVCPHCFGYGPRFTRIPPGQLRDERDAAVRAGHPFYPTPGESDGAE